MLLDLVDVYGTSVNMMSAVFVVSCVGGILGSFAGGLLQQSRFHLGNKFNSVRQLC